MSIDTIDCIIGLGNPTLRDFVDFDKSFLLSPLRNLTHELKHLRSIHIHWTDPNHMIESGVGGGIVISRDLELSSGDVRTAFFHNVTKMLMGMKSLRLFCIMLDACCYTFSYYREGWKRMWNVKLETYQTNKGHWGCVCGDPA